MSVFLRVLRLFSTIVCQHTWVFLFLFPHGCVPYSPTPIRVARDGIDPTGSCSTRMLSSPWCLPMCVCFCLHGVHGYIYFVRRCAYHCLFFFVPMVCLPNLLIRRLALLGMAPVPDRPGDVRRRRAPVRVGQVPQRRNGRVPRRPGGQVRGREG